MKFRFKDSNRAMEIVKRMTVRELINQCICPFHFPENNLDNVDEYGGLFVFGGKEIRLKEVISRYKAKCTVKPFIVSDFENGAGGMIDGATRFSSMMGCSETDSAELAYEMGRIGGGEGISAGFNWTFGPVVDLYHNPNSPMVSTRSAGSTPDQVIKIAGAYMKGVQAAGMMATLKHFPGDGRDVYDQHLTTPVNNSSKEEWNQREGRIYRELIEEGVMAIMPGHIALPCYDSREEKTGLYPPATLSGRLMTDLLRGELGFEGVIVSDAVNMGGIVNFKNYYEACALFWEAGGDMLLFPDVNKFHERILPYLENGTLREETLRNRAYRILCVKDMLGILDDINGEVSIDRERNERVSREIVDRGVKLVRDREGLIPFNINKDTRILHVVIINNHESYKNYIDRLNEELAGHAESVETFVDAGPDKLFNEIIEGRFDLVICSLGGKPEYGVNSCDIYGPMVRNMMGGWMKLGTPVIFVACEDPYAYKRYEAAADTIINLYGLTAYTPERLIDGIIGKNPFNKGIYTHK
ncbi:MAG: glycoside hydrolase family 3 N-terminal domain-containing protein [Bacillota bacterium]|nr:glycoside hydrolase family 3 N-terminal domain-containing protein [Bacillota bacterium]